ncbi:Ferredoxin subunits of nitrite reductase and ring-hydroxylating dioxygenase [Vulgatibacter incomptus]|uniref:Ferredoxin subunits of nitrite reductase and ring-hydroxylating dioxygenase n=1 Tax=Vulgatibacter incomptus TaxID=1391653 RepID=A0A0K1PDP6_9BACT|nr:Ferredoxin subunits of nitrite reductase and ring-hydroxylating dioxygenase [Vulgatibacter incomptus]
MERGAIRFRLPRPDGDVEAFAIRFEGQLRAWVNVCTHRALELDLGSGSFFARDGRLLLCRAHGALFDPLDGSCAGGVCGKGTGLAAVKIVEEDGILWSEDP